MSLLTSVVGVYCTQELEELAKKLENEKKAIEEAAKSLREEKDTTDQYVPISNS